MAAMTTGATSRKPGSFADALAWVVVGAAGVLALLPILLCAALCSLALSILRPPRWLPIFVLMLAGGIWLWWLHVRAIDPARLVLELAIDYARTQQAAASTIAQQRSLAAFPWLSYGHRIGLCSLVGGCCLSVCLWACGGSALWPGYQGAGAGLRVVGADVLAKLPDVRDEAVVDGLVARGRLTAITALPKRGKTYAYFGLLRARQEGGTWFGRRCRRGRTLILSEEDRATFAGKVKQFGIRSKTLVSIHAPEVDASRFGQAAWPAFIDEAARRARKARCDTLDVDTLTTWCPWVIQSPDAMSFCLRTLKAAVGRYQLAGVVILHNRKSGGEAVVAALGTIAGPAAYDVIAGFDREKDSGVCTLIVDGRLGEWQQTARLVGQRYVVGGEPPEAPPAPTPPIDRDDYRQYLTSPEWAARREAALTRAGGVCEACGTAPATMAHHKTYERIGEELPGDLAALCASCHHRVHHGHPLPDLAPHVAATLARLRSLDHPATAQEVASLAGITRVPALVQLKALEAASLVTVEGSGKQGDPKRWRLR